MMNQIDLQRLCKEKNIQKNKNTIIEILKDVNNKNISELSLDTFHSFL